MTIEKLRQAREASPFRPFTIRTADGRAYRVPHREFIWMPPKAQRTVVVSDEDGGEDYAIIDLLLVTALEFGEPTPNRTNGQRKDAAE